MTTPFFFLMLSYYSLTRFRKVDLGLTKVPSVKMNGARRHKRQAESGRVEYHLF